jgi:hypothetical protein
MRKCFLFFLSFLPSSADALGKKDRRERRMGEEVFPPMKEIEVQQQK